MASVARPFGITLLAVLHVLQAIIYFLGGIGLIALGEFMRRGYFGMHRFLGGAAAVIGVVVLIVGVLYLGLAWGLWGGKGWAWTVSLILAALGIIFSLISLVFGGFAAIIVLILDAIIIYYLLTPHVRRFFGEYRSGAPTQLPATQPTQQSPPPSTGNRFCSNCGAPVQTNEKFCSHCGTAAS